MLYKINAGLTLLIFSTENVDQNRSLEQINILNLDDMIVLLY